MKFKEYESAPAALQIQGALNTLVAEGDVFEVRIPRTRLHGTVAGWFRDKGKAALLMSKFNADAPGLYVTLNPVNPDVMSRAADRLETRAQVTTTDSEILRRVWLPIDFDPRRPTGVSSSNIEHEMALVKATDVRERLESLGWPAPLVGDSGNGAHLLYRIDLPNDQDSTRLISDVLRAIAAEFNDQHVLIDVGNFNAARIWKVYGSVAAKGDSTPERPWRVSTILYRPAEFQTVTAEQMGAYVAHIRETTKQDSTAANGRPIQDLAAYVESLGVPVARGPMPLFGNGHKWILEKCPFNPDHKNPMIGMVDGKAIYRCLHNSCQDHGWRQFREKIDPAWASPDRVVRSIIDENGATLLTGQWVQGMARLSSHDYAEGMVELKKAGIQGLREFDKLVKAERRRQIEAAAEGLGVPGNIYGLLLQVQQLQSDGIVPMFWHNELDGTDRIGPVEQTAKWRDIDGEAIDLLVEFHKHGQKWVKRSHAYEAIEKLSRMNVRNPLAEYMDRLEWDGVVRLDTWLHKYMGAANDVYTAAVGRKWMISAAARALRPGCQADHMIVLEGAQGIGKTQALRTLGGEFYAEFTGGLSSTRDHQHLVSKMLGKLIIEMSEMSTLRRSQIETLKALITESEDTIRLAYRRDAKRYARTCVFAGTTNETGEAYIPDTTGARRFWPVVCGIVDLPGLTRARDQLWAEAVHAFRAGEDWYKLPEAEAREEQDERRHHAHEDPWHQTIAARILSRDALAEGFTVIRSPRLVLTIKPVDMMQIWLGVPIRDQDMFKAQRLFRVLRSIGFRSKHQYRLHGEKLRGWAISPATCCDQELGDALSKFVTDNHIEGEEND